MTFKEDVKEIKKELSAQEEFIKSLIKGEKILRKYKYYFMSLILIIVLYISSSFIYDNIKENNLLNANDMYLKLLQNNKDEILIQKLKQENINLYTLFLLNQIKKDSNNTLLKEIANNENLNDLLKNVTYLNTDEKSIFLKQYYKLIQAYNLLQENKIKEANVIFSSIKDPVLEKIIQNLKHYQGIK